MNTPSASVVAQLDDLVIDAGVAPVAAPVVVAPSTDEEVVRILTIAASHGLSVVPFGAGSSLAGSRADIALTTKNLSGVVDYQPDDLTAVVGAGTSLEELEQHLVDRRLTAVLPEETPERTVGGVVASGASGYRRLKYGPTRDRVLEVTLATGYGEVVRAGGRVVKNVSGYDVARLATGSLGSLGVITSVCLKLWPEPESRRTVRVDSAANALASVYKPVAILETLEGSFVFLEGDEATANRQSEALRGDVSSGFSWPVVDLAPVNVSLRLPPSLVTAGIGAMAEIEVDWFVAQHGVGIIEAGLHVIDAARIDRVRRWAEARGGSLVLTAAGLTSHERWGSPPASFAVQERLKHLFDPSGVCNPGALPGGL